MSCGAKEIYSFSKQRLEGYYDKGGNYFSFGYIYDGAHYVPGKLASITDPLNRTVAMNYTAKTNIASIVDWAGRTNSFEYSTNYDRLVSITYPPTPEFPTGAKKRFDYESADAYAVTGVGWNNDAAYESIAYGADRFATNETFIVGNASSFSYDFP